MNSRPNDSDGGELLFIIGVAILGTIAVSNWLVGNLAAVVGRGRPLHASIADALAAAAHLPKHPGDPRLAWPPADAANLPGPFAYWASAVVVLGIVVLVAGIVVAKVSGSRHDTVDRRERLGVRAQARLARTRDLRSLLTTRPEPGRFLLARWGRRRWLATEAANLGGRRGVRGAVAVFGPSQSGKTTGLIAGLGAWEGPAIVSSVKTDLYRATRDARTAGGEIKVFDPLGVTGADSATWSPLAAAKGLAGALAAAQMLTRAGRDDGPHDRFWRGQAEQLLAAMLWTAANTEGHTMRHVVRWVLELDRPSDDSGGTLAPVVRLLTDHTDENIALAAHQVQGWLHGQWNTDPRTTSSVYATARDAVWPWADPDIAASAETSDITLDWLPRRQQHPVPVRPAR